ncbi:hypothetical protein BDF22DRAFT_685051, partial [Syncephalis plumigaleata]
MNSTTIVDNPQVFDSVLAALPTVPRNTFIYFYGSINPDTGLSWCPDCVDVEDKINTTVVALPDSLLIRCPVGDRSEWKNNPNHLYRRDPRLHLTAIPTLIRWQRDGDFENRLVEDECNDDAKLNAL